MPVKSAEITPGMFLTDSYPNPVSEPLLPDDIWHKFQLDFLQLPGISEVANVIPTPPPEESSLNRLNEVWSGSHDCMWAGHCGSREHDESRHPSRLIPTLGAGLMRPPPVPVIKQENRPACSQQQSLLKPKSRNDIVQTPPPSDEEELRNSKAMSLLLLLRDAIVDHDLEGEAELCRYLDDPVENDVSMYTFKDPRETEEEDSDDDDDEEEDDEDDEVIVDTKPEARNANMKSCKTAAESDHSYHKGGPSSSAQHPEFGMETPSDSEYSVLSSEEEIDVVSVVDKFQNKAFMPHKPSKTERQHIQRRVATAISRKNVGTGIKSILAAGIKTILPQRKAAEKTVAPAASRRKAAGTTPTTGVKRPRGRKSQNASYKRRNYGHSSDSEQEPSEKRSLHNNMERQRRIDLRNAFEDLRVLIPEVCKKERAAKVVILREATQYCLNLNTTSTNYSLKMSELRRKQDKLRSQVAQLRVENAEKHIKAQKPPKAQ